MKKTKAPKIVTIAILSLATVILWIIFSVIASITKPAELNIPPEITEPINPTLDLTTLQSLSEKIYFSENSGIQTIITLTEDIVVEEIAEEIIEEIATESAELDNSATESAEIEQ
jgi:hypothetical protein